MTGPGDQTSGDARLERTVGRKAERRRRAEREERHGVWFGLGMFGLVGWAVAVPTLAGTALGLWLDTTFAGPPSWTITFLVAGVAVGCLNAWWWVRRHGSRLGGDDGGNGNGTSD